MKEVCIKVPTDVVRIVIELEREQPAVVTDPATVEAPVVEKPEVKVEPKPEVKAEPKPAKKKPEPKPEVKEEPKPEPKPEVKPQAPVQVEIPSAPPTRKLPPRALANATPPAPITEADCVMFDRRNADHRNLFGALVSKLLGNGDWVRDPMKMEWAKEFLATVHLQRACVIPSQNRLTDDFCKDVKDALIPTT